MKFKKIFSCVFACCIAGCTVSYTLPSSAVFSAKAQDSDTSNDINFTAVGQYTTIRLSGTEETPVWYSDNTSVATVDSNGVITAAGEGTATVYAVFSSQVLEFDVTVTIAPEQTDFYMGEINLSAEHPSAQINLGGADLTGTVWSSSDNSVAVVDNSGKVTATGSGNCTVTASVNGKNYIIDIISTYDPSNPTEPITEVILGSLELSNEKNKAIITLSNVPEGTVVEWSSTNIAVASVTQDGTVTVTGSGECQIIALIDGVKYITNVTSTYVPQEQKEVVLGSMELSNEKTYGKIILSGVPEGAAVEWSSTDEDVASVDDEGVVTAISSGECRIIALINGVMYIMNVSSTYTAPAISADTTEINGIGNTLQLKMDNSQESPEWISTNTNVATVDENGLVTAVGTGSAVILAKLSSKVCSITITVSEEGSYIPGDADVSGGIDVNDVVKIMCYSINSVDYPIDEVGLNNADVYQRGDGVNSGDAFSVQKRLVNIIEFLPES